MMRDDAAAIWTAGIRAVQPERLVASRLSLDAVTVAKASFQVSPFLDRFVILFPSLSLSLSFFFHL